MTRDLRLDIAAFWRFFSEECASLVAAGSADSKAYDEILAALQRIDSELYFEFSLSPEDCELIITADGKKKLFSLVDLVVAQAPRIPGWRVFALKPKIGFPIKMRWEGLELELSDVSFELLRHVSTGQLGLRLYVAGISAAQTTDAHNAILRAIDHGIGERAAAEQIVFSEVLPLDRATHDATLHPLSELEKHLSP